MGCKWMNPIIKKIPLPMSGLMLALASAGNLLAGYGNSYRYTLGALSAILFLLLSIKIAVYPESLAEGFENPVVASVLPTFSMGMMIFPAYIKAFSQPLALVIWIMGLLLHIVLMGSFTKKYMFNFGIKKVFPSYFIVYVGIICGSMTAPALGLAAIGRYIFWFGLAAYIVLLPIILYRIAAVREIPEPALPTIVIMTAPSSLCLAGYLSTFQEKSISMIVFLGALSLIMLISVLACMPRLLKLKFYPSYSAFTFPFVITSIAAKGTLAFLGKAGFSTAIFKYPMILLEIWSLAMVLYVLARYVFFLTSSVSATKAESGVKA